MDPLKGGRFDIHFHRRDAEDLFNFLLSAETRLTRLSESDGEQGAENKNQQPLSASRAKRAVYTHLPTRIT